MSSFTQELFAWCVCFCKGFLWALKWLPLPMHPACCVPSGSLAVDVHYSPPALDTRDLSMCAESHTETLWLPGHFSIVHSLEPFLYRCSFQASSRPPTHAWFSWAPFSLILWFFSWLSPCWFLATLPAGMQWSQLASGVFDFIQHQLPLLSFLGERWTKTF